MNCIHRWLVQPPDGSEHLQARCLKCGAERTFEVVPKENQWNRTPGTRVKK